MTKHLTWDEISSVLIGERGRSVEHARGCDSCGADLARLESALSEFRGGMRNWSGQAFRQREFVRKLDADYSGSVWKAGLSSLLINGTMLAMIVYVGTLKPVQLVMQGVVRTMIAPKLEPFKPENKGGGGGGARQPLEPKKADLPKAAPRQFTPPRVDPVESRLEMEPTIIADMPVLNSSNLGDVKGLSFPSNGPGTGGGIGTSCCGGIGPGNGPGAGPGSKGGFGVGVYRPGGGVSGPILLHKVEPQYSDEARKAKWQGTVRLQLVVDTNGKPTSIQVITPLGLGLDTKAVEAVEQWLFKPGTKDGKPVPVIAVVDVSFRLL